MAYTREAAHIRKTFFQDTTFTDGVYRWQSNGAVPPADVLDCVADLIPAAVLEHCTGVRDRETQEFLAAYRQNAQEPNAEQLADLRAAFGPGAEVVNVVTGKKIRLPK